ncbi:hypothetical protein N9L19_00470 [bacterium]|nr:hypothetical protein [bacterium]
MPSDVVPYEAPRQSRFNTPEFISVLGGVIRRLRLLKRTRAAIGRKCFNADLKVLATASSEDFMEAMNIANPSESISAACARPDMPAKVKTALRTLLLSTSDVPSSERRKTQLRYNGHGHHLLFGASSFFVTPNFADTYNPLVLQHHEGPGRNNHLSIGGASQPAGGASQPAEEITRVAPRMPSLERMHQIVAADPRAQATFGILMLELHYRYIHGAERLQIGRSIFARPHLPVHDEVAASLQPCVSPGTADVQAPFEAQGRGFFHGHGKGHSIIGPTMKWLRAAVASALGGLANAARKLREALLATACTMQYEAAKESARQLGVDDIPPEPFTAKQQRQSRMDGGEDEDGSMREYVQLAPPVEQPHITKERARAAAENRTPMLGSAAYRKLCLTGAFQATFPWYRQRSSFGRLSAVSQLTDADGDASDASVRNTADIFQVDETGEVLAALLPDGTQSTSEDLHKDAQAWAAHFGRDAFNNHCSNHDHDCTGACVKYVKNKLEAKQSLRSNKIHSCRFLFFRIKKLLLEGRERAVRRRGNQLVSEPFIEESDERNQQCRCQVKRAQPFRSHSNDVSEVCDRSNVDYQLLPCAPAEASTSGAPQPAASGSGAHQPAPSTGGAFGAEEETDEEDCMPDQDTWFDGEAQEHNKMVLRRRRASSAGPSRDGQLCCGLPQGIRHGLLYHEIPLGDDAIVDALFPDDGKRHTPS